MPRPKYSLTKAKDKYLRAMDNEKQKLFFKACKLYEEAKDNFVKFDLKK